MWGLSNGSLQTATLQNVWVLLILKTDCGKGEEFNKYSPTKAPKAKTEVQRPDTRP